MFLILNANKLWYFIERIIDIELGIFNKFDISIFEKMKCHVSVSYYIL